MAFDYDGRKWDINPTPNDTNSLFHAIFGLRRGGDGIYVDNIAHIRRTNWQNFLSYYENKQRPTFLKNTLRELYKNHNWCFEKDDNFNEYVEYAGQDRQVLLDELPLIAALENVKIVLFEDETGPKIIEPSTEAISDYPLASIRHMETVVIVFKDSLYSKLTPLSQKSLEDEEKEEVPKTFEKRRIGLASGIWYEINLLSIVLLNALDKYDVWRLSANPLNLKYFNDLILEFGPENSAFLVQAKWKEKKVYLGNLFGKKYSGFSLAKYFFAYQALKNNYNVHNVAICTNTSIEFDWLKDFVNSRDLNQHDLLYFEGSKSICHTFKDKIVPHLLENFKHYDGDGYRSHLVTKENVENFLSYFQIVSLYPRGKSLEQAIEDKIIHMSLCKKDDGLDYARHLNRKIMEWYDKNDEYLTPLHAKIIVCGLKNDKLLTKLNNVRLALKSDRLHIGISKKICHIIPQNDFTLSLLKVSKFLANEYSRTLFLSTIESAQNQKLIVEAFECQQYSYLVIFKTDLQNGQDLCDIIKMLLDKFNDKKVILIANRHDELAEMLKDRDASIFEAIDDDVTFTDLTEKSQEQLLEKAILYYEENL